MIGLKSSLVGFLRDEEGATAVEYALIASLVAAVIVLAVATLGSKTSSSFTTMETAMP